MINSYGTLTVIQLITVITLSSYFLSVIGKKCNYSFKELLKKRSGINFILLLLYILTIFGLLYLSGFREIGDYGSKIGGYDAYNYKAFFSGALKSTHFEPGFVLLVNIIRLFSKDYSFFLIVVSCIMLFCMIKFLKKLKNHNFYLIFMLICLYFSSFNTLRTSLAIFIFLLTIIELNNQKYLRSIIFACLATSIHFSSLIIFPVIVINYLFKSSNKISTTRIIFLVVLMTVILLGISYYVTKYLSLTSYESYLGNGQLVINVYLFAALIFYVCKKNYNKLVKVNPMNKVLITTIPIIFLVFPMQLIMVIMYRMIEFFLPIIYASMAEIIDNEKKQYVKLLITLLFIYKIVDFFNTCYYLGITKWF